MQKILYKGPYEGPYVYLDFFRLIAKLPGSVDTVVDEHFMGGYLGSPSLQFGDEYRGSGTRPEQSIVQLPTIILKVWRYFDANIVYRSINYVDEKSLSLKGTQACVSLHGPQRAIEGVEKIIKGVIESELHRVRSNPQQGNQLSLNLSS